MHVTDWYRLGDGYLGLRSEHAGLTRRFELLFEGCREVPPADTTWPRLRCDVEVPPNGHRARIRFTDSVPLDMVDFAVDMFGDRGCREVDPGTFPGRAFALTENGSEVVLGCSGDELIANLDQMWEWLAGNLAVHRLFRLQSGVAFFHAASVAVHGRGLMMVGDKGTGKTTLSLALAARGHGFLGDELAALRLASAELIPLRRSTSIRPGPRSGRVDAALRSAGLPVETFPDGTTRVRATIDRLLPMNRAAATRLAAMVFLRGMGSSPRLEPFVPQRQHLGLLTPMRSTLWHARPAERAIRLLAILPKARCYWLDAGEPDATAELLETALGDS